MTQQVGLRPADILILQVERGSRARTFIEYSPSLAYAVGLLRQPRTGRASMVDGMISTEQAEELHKLRGLVGEREYQRIQRETWKLFSKERPPLNEDGELQPLALYSVCDELIQTLREAMHPDARGKQTVESPGELLWELRKDGITWSAHVESLGAGNGWEVTVSRDGQLSLAERFVLRAHAVAWADNECADIAKGWR